MNTYRGKRLNDGSAIIEVEDNETGHVTYRSSRDESYPEFNWGYNGSGPWYVAEFLLKDVTNDFDVAKKFSGAFSTEFSSCWGDGWVITSNEILQWISNHRS